MNIRCPHCQTVFRVNPDRIPASGVRAKCARCGDTFLVTPPAGPPRGNTTEPASAAAAPAPPPRAAAVSTPPQHAPVTPADPEAEAAPAAPPSDPGRAGVAATTADPAAADTLPAQTSGAPTFGARDPRAKAERLARALVSDIVAYHPDRRDRSLAGGTLRTEFREEIMKSWEEYVAQVGLEVAKSTPYFRDALNTILARGQKLF